MEEIEFIVEERHISDSFMGLILVPLVEKLAEHLTVSSFLIHAVILKCCSDFGTLSRSTKRGTIK